MDNFKLLRGTSVSILSFGEYQTKLEKLDNNLLYIEIKDFWGTHLTTLSEIIEMTGTIKQYEQLTKNIMPNLTRMITPRMTMKNYIQLLTHVKFN